MELILNIPPLLDKLWKYYNYISHLIEVGFREDASMQDY